MEFSVQVLWGLIYKFIKMQFRNLGEYIYIWTQNPGPTVYTIYLQIHMDIVFTVYHKYWKIG